MAYDIGLWADDVAVSRPTSPSRNTGFAPTSPPFSPTSCPPPSPPSPPFPHFSASQSFRPSSSSTEPLHGPWTTPIRPVFVPRSEVPVSPLRLPTPILSEWNPLLDSFPSPAEPTCAVENQARWISALSNDVLSLRCKLDRQIEELIKLREALEASRADKVRMRFQLEYRMEEVEMQVRDFRRAMQDQYEREIAEIQRCAAYELKSISDQLQDQINDKVEQLTAPMRETLQGLCNVSQNVVNFNGSVSQTIAGLQHQIQNVVSVTSVLGQRTQVMEGHLNHVRSVQGRMQGDIKAAMYRMNETQATGIKLEAVEAERGDANMGAQTGNRSYGQMPNGLI